MNTQQEGGCLCGNVRYKLSGQPALQLFCYCSDCRRFSGTEGWAGYMVKEHDFALIVGNPKVYIKTSAEGRKVKMNFCGDCGSSLFGITEFGLISVAAGSLDNPEIFTPKSKVFTEHSPHWARIPSYLSDM